MAVHLYYRCTDALERKGDCMEIFNEIVDFFGLTPLTAQATIVDVVNYLIAVFVAVYIVIYFFKFLFYVCALPSTMRW